MAEETKGQRTYRRAPQDLAEAQYIHGLIKADVAANIGQLAQNGEHDKMQAMLGYQSKWGEIVKHLSAPTLAQMAAPQVRETGMGVHIPTAAKALDTPVNAESQPTASGGTADEGGARASRTPRR